MATNDFLTFAAATGSNVLTQSAYADPSNTARQTGYVTGTASSAAVNKTLRQTSIMASMIGQFIADQTSQNVVDDGTITTIETNFAQAILNVAAGRVIQISDVVGLTGALAGKLSTTGNAASASKWASPITLALTGQVTGAVAFDGSSNVTLSASVPDGALSIAKTSGLSASLAALAPINNANLTGTTNAQALNVNGSSVVTIAGFSTYSDSNGTVTRFPDGTIIARGVMAAGGSSVTFPSGIAFSQAPVVTATTVNNLQNPNGYSMSIYGVATNGFQVRQNFSLSIYWMAVGR